MLRFVFLATAFALALGAPSGDVRVSLNAISSSVQSIDEITIAATITNPTQQDIRLVAVNNLLDSSPTQSFMVNKGEKMIGFTGIRAIFDMSQDSAYKVIPAGSSVTVNHTKLAPLYDFQSGGVGKFKFAPVPLYLWSANKSMAIQMPDVTVEVTGDVTRRVMGREIEERSTPVCANLDNLAFIQRALTDATALARDAAFDIQGNPDSADINRYFKNNNRALIANRFNEIADDRGIRTITCADPFGRCPSVVNPPIAYTSLAIDPLTNNIISSNIFVCPVFFRSRPTPTICQSGFDSTLSSDGGIILHELSHANHRTADLGYGCNVAAGLSAPDQLNNADNYRCMALAVYAFNNCPRA